MSNFADDMNRKISQFDPKGFNKLVLRIIIAVVALILAAVLVDASFVVTRPNEYIIVQQFGRIMSITTEPGLSFRIPLIQSQRSIPKSVQIYDIPISDVISKDKKTMVCDSFVLWKVTDPSKFIKSMNGNVSVAESRIGNIVYNSMKNVISNLDQVTIISGRDTLAQNIFQYLGTSLEEYGITVIAVETKSLDLPDDNKMAVYERMISERNNIAASFQAEGESEARMIRTETEKTISIQLSEANAGAEKLIAEGEAEYMHILAEAYNDPERAEFYSFVRSLDAAKKSLQGETTLILSPDSPLVQIFYQQ